MPQPLKVSDCSSYVPPNPGLRIPRLGDTVLFVLGPSGEGVKFKPKMRAAKVVEDWSGLEQHPTGQVRGPDGKVIVELSEDGKPVLYDGGGNMTTDEKVGRPRPYVPAGCVNLEIHLDMVGKKDMAAGHDRYEGHVLYDPKKSHKTWHWPGD